MRSVDPVKVDCSLPDRWAAAPLDETPLYTHQQWKSPSHATGLGVLYARVPFPIGAKTLLWFARLQYGKETTGQGKALGEWTDDLGRPWFEAENAKYHVCGYAIVRGLDAWIVYYGFRVKSPPNPSELSLAARFAETVVPHGPADAPLADSTSAFASP